jgi:signal transduction histidine kinase
MNAIELVQYTTDAIFIAIFVAALLRALRNRRRATLDAALVFGALGIVIIGGLVSRAFGLSGSAFSLLIASPLLALPFLTLRVVDHLVPVRRNLLRAAFAGAVLSIAAFALLPRAVLLPVAVAVLAYFVGVEAYAGFVVVRAGRRATGIARPRLLAIGAGTLFLGGAMLVLLAVMLVPNISVATNILGLACAISYYLGFVTPAVIQRSWREPLLRDFFVEVTRLAAQPDLEELVPALARATKKVTGSQIVGIGIWNEDRRMLRFYSTDTPVMEVPIEETTSARAFTEQRPLMRTDGDGLGPFSRQMLELDLHSALAVPITWGNTRFGVLGGYAYRTPLFAEEELALLGVLAGQIALKLRNHDLVGSVRSLNAELERRVLELDAANDELSSFAYAVSHDLRAPLRAIDGFSDVLLEEKSAVLGEDGRGQLARVRAAAQRMGLLIDDLLDLSRTTRAEVRRQPIDLSALARAVAADHAARAPERSVAFHAQDGLEASGDDRLLRIVLDNLIGNAWKFTRPVTNPRIEVGMSGENGTRAYYVRDNGVGFEMEYRKKLFTPFQRLHAQRDFEGTGIGLATVRRVIRKHGGDVWAESEPGRGATFFFTLPAE